MYSHTKKVGSMGRYGPRVGRKVRHEALKIEDEMKKPKHCPKCGKTHVKRKAAGIWLCCSCKLSFAGGAYTPFVMKKAVEQVAHEAKTERSKFKRAAKEELEERSEEQSEEQPAERKAKRKPKIESPEAVEDATDTEK
ncbi:MAG: 50S ribosomal protein L37ae [Candidatus Altiarchaeota archaeon]|nr:50S ribosomal protein L37ae [Candidatus Altiarchaeota archaeon]